MPKFKGNKIKMKVENLEYKKFGLLTIIKREENGKNGHARWLCKCDCGNNKIYTSMELKKLQNPNCGCIPPKNFKDLTGKRIGLLKIIKKIGYKERGKNKIKSVLWLCKCDCGKNKELDSKALNSGKNKSCGCDQFKKMEKHHNWKGGKRFGKNGYVELRIPNHPNAHSGYVSEHVYVMCNYLGRILKKGENVHHKNGIRNDNRIENLELWTTHHPYGQRVSDMIEFCINYLKEYKPEYINKELK